jgi:hypothetical protein
MPRGTVPTAASKIASAPLTLFPLNNKGIAPVTLRYAAAVAVVLVDARESVAHG